MKITYINVPKIINAATEKTGETSPDVKPLPLLIVDHNIPAIKKGAGIFVFPIRNPQKTETTMRINISKRDNSTLACTMRFRLASSYISVITKGVNKTRIRTLVF